MRKSLRRSLGILCLGALAAGAQELAQVEGAALAKPLEEDLRNLSLLIRQLMPADLPPELRALNSAVNRAVMAGETTAAWRLLTRMTLALQGQKWSDGLEILSSYRLLPGRRLLQQGEAAEVELQPLFTLGRAPREAYTIRLGLRDARGREARPARTFEVREFTPLKHAFDTTGLKDGDYELVYELASAKGERVAEVRRPVTLERRLDERLARLKSLTDAAPRAAEDVRMRTAVETAEYLHGIMARARSEYVSSGRLRAHPLGARILGVEELSRYTGEPFDLKADLPLAERLMAAARKGSDPFAGLTGDLRLAYRSGVDQTLQPFRVYVPARHKGRLLVTLHGVAGDENSYFGPFTGGLLAKLAEERGYVVASPNGRGPVGGYVGASRQDVLDVRERALALFGLDGKQVFLTGHSMGAMGAFQIVFEKPELWAAAAPVAGTIGVSRRMFEKNPEVPVLLAQGGKDRLALPSLARTVAGYAKETLRTFEYREYPEADHFSIGAASITDVFDFCDRVAAGRAK
jgi:poly(3-hydroxybutyrate) depolymerase